MVVFVQGPLKSSNPILSRAALMREGGLKTVAAGDLTVRAALGTDRDGGAREPLPHRPGPGLPPLVTGDLLTLDAVVRRAAATLAVAVVAAGLTWAFRPADIRVGYVAAGCPGLVAALLTVVQRRRGTPSAALAFAFASAEGAFLGLLSGAASLQTSSGAAVQTVLGTMTGSVGVLIAYRARVVRMSRRFRGYAAAGALGAVLLASTDRLVALLLGPGSLGLVSEESWIIGALCGLAGLLLATPAMSVHIQRIEEVIAEGAPARLAWTAAFGLTLTLVWLYVEALRVSTLVGDEELWL
ncbi:Bax inhibitor-1/YccA family membrane protein [Streptacidiphilus jiangxiensis]|uniref:Uncharacterized membrane protein, YccA/Bax inhibitor family n=1 Tax=Streptacidiphilus jiangxiensis TaxID=235985 RepID=A0A1H7WG69_STRJI|nr:Bax inhibitor-1/YccA family protein [Streptacidiphilus jiangxiensis]SEM20556.1 Uncharacterized membrane protein, YccA/Bax inhibitor family [Streptacidiphilus jiangxiensis]